MLWVALATAIMLLSGELTREANDVRAIAALLAGLRKSITRTVPPSPRREQALCAVQNFEWAFAEHQRDLHEFGVCLEAADRNYHATSADYAACSERLAAERATIHDALAVAQRNYEAALTPEERAHVVTDVMAMKEAHVLESGRTQDASGVKAPQRRFRGIEGVAADRHLTQPRNVITLLYGPLASPTFGQRYPSKIVEGGTTYGHESWAGANPVSPTFPDSWVTRFGVRFGMFDDFEVTALFGNVEFAPKVRLDQVLVAFTQQFRFTGVDLALRASFLTPSGDAGWALSPGVMLRTHSPVLALHAGVFAPMEVGTTRDPQAPVIGINAPLRLTWNIVPSVFVSAESGLAYDNLGVRDGITVPLGFGAGYAFLVGSRLIELTSSFTWSDWLVPARPNGVSALQLGVFRVAFGASLSFQAL